MLPRLCSLLGDPGKVAVDSGDPNVIIIAYPAAFSEAYIRPEIRLEIGPLAIWLPNAGYEIYPYAAEEFPAQFTEQRCRVQAIKAERTFWEKVTILHHEAHRPEGSPQPVRYSRHYYDLARMVNAKVKDSALRDLALLRSVVASKDRFYPRGWARYDLAVPGAMKLIPPGHVLPSLRRDYKEMQIMIYGERPEFDEILRQIQALEHEINALSST